MTRFFSDPSLHGELSSGSNDPLVFFRLYFRAPKSDIPTYSAAATSDRAPIFPPAPGISMTFLTFLQLPPDRLLVRMTAVLLGWAAVVSAWAVQPGRVLTDIGEVHALSPEQAAAKLPVSLHGVITRVTPYELFIQNGSDAIFVWQRHARPDLRMGDYVEVTGLTHSGHLFPVVKEPLITVLEHRHLPEPKRVPYGELASGRVDGQWIEVEGIVRTIETRPDGGLSLRILFDGELLRAETTALATNQVPTQLLGARIRLRGVISGSKTSQRRIIEPVLWVAFMSETFVMETPGPAEIFSVPLRPAGTLNEYGGSSFPGDMVRVTGIVTSRPAPRLLFVRDKAQALEIRLQQPAALSVGDRIEAAGFPEMGSIQPILQDAFVRRIAPGELPMPRRIEDVARLDFSHEAELIEVEGDLREIFRHNDGLVMLLATKGRAFNVDLADRLAAPQEKLPPVGSRLSLVGICQIDRVTPPNASQMVAPASFRLRLRSLEDLRVLSRPPWWTPRRLLTAVALLSLLVLGTLGWIWMLDRRVRAQTRIILRKAQNEAMLEERNRIAREFHDTVEQQLAGATILLDAIASMVNEQPERARHGLNTARAMLRHSLEEAQQAVSDLRNNDLFEHDLKPLIEAAVRERLQNTSITADFHYDGTWPDLDTVVKKHLLRIVQESVTNAIKHAAPTRIAVVMLAAKDRIELQVADNGCGFDVHGRKRHGPGEFGLVGLQERAEKIGARLTIQSAPQRGTTVALSLQRTALAI
jgi:signal transduction histidine kinase